MEVLLKRGYMALEDSEWDKAEAFFNRVLDIDPELAGAYLGMAMAQAKCQTVEEFRGRYTSVAWEKDDKNMARAKQYATPELQKIFERWDVEKAEKEAAAARLAAEEAAAIAAKKAEMRPVYAQYRKRSDLAAKRICIGNGYRVDDSYYVALNTDGTVVAGAKKMGSQCDVSNWTDIVSIAAGDNHTVGLKVDGTVLAIGNNGYGQCNVGSWTDVVAIASGPNHTVGLKSDGTVVAAGDNTNGQCDVSDWANITVVAASGSHTVGLRADGTVVAAGWNQHRQCIVGHWTDIVDVAVSADTTVGLRADGTVVAVGRNDYGECCVSDWTDIVAIAIGTHTVGLKLDGTVVVAGYERYGRCDVSSWTDIVALICHGGCTVGLKSNGTVKETSIHLGYEFIRSADGDIRGGKRSVHYTSWVNDWKLFENIDTFEQEIAQAKERRQIELEEKRQQEEERRRQEEERLRQEEAERRRTEEARQKRMAPLKSERADLHLELANLKGLFTGKRRKEIEARLAQIELELKKL